MQEAKIIELAENEAFYFGCNPEVPCFNHCCRDLNQFLTPYDIIRLKNHFCLPSGLFLERYTRNHLGPQTRLPVVTLKPAPGGEGICPFVTPDGCGVYENRPSSCRMYPLIRVLSSSRESDETHVRYALLQESHCRGHERRNPITPGEWMINQGLEPYNAMNDRMMDIIRLKNQFMPGYLTQDAHRLFFTLCYDIDAFRADTGNPAWRGIRLPDAGHHDDADLLRLGLVFLQEYLFTAAD